ncbi:GlxA family transcriptional regulator [Streptomyces sp. NPDC012746]|uniref:GlxA family transcriptional regulator n=1 Tax=Streptomyces sp. NPDC012746 TaxID=3364845 RepID=UPI003695161E
MRPRTVLVTLFDGVEALDVTGPLGVLAGANAYLAATAPGQTAYRIATASPGGVAVDGLSGVTLGADGDLAAAAAPHTLIVPGGTRYLTGPTDCNPEVVQWLRRNAPKSQRVVSVCTGAFLLAEAGLLAGKRATTHWSRAEELAKRYPDVSVDPTPIFVQDGSVYTAAGVMAGIDLALAFVEEDLGRDAAMTVARYMIVFLRRSGGQSQFSAQMRAQIAQRPVLREIQQWIADHPDADLSVEALARRANLSPRQFTRSFSSETGSTPGRYVAHTRLETARRLLEDTQEDVVRVASDSGYSTAEAMRRAFQRTLGLSPSQYRSQHS